jgi:hypothetical protein
MYFCSALFVIPLLQNALGELNAALVQAHRFVGCKTTLISTDMHIQKVYNT